jgi:uncharacterized membrane protein
MNPEQRLEEILAQIHQLSNFAQKFEAQINSLQSEVEEIRTQLKFDNQTPQKVFKKPPPIPINLSQQFIEAFEATETPILESEKQEKLAEIQDYGLVGESKSSNSTIPTEQKPFNLEDYIGRNVLGKVGILILIIGISVFVKYAVDHEILIIPIWVRVALAYLAGAVLIGLSYWLKEKYKTYSALLFGGGLATFYFTTFIAHSFFGLMPQGVAFGIMVLCTIYAVYEAHVYDEEAIGIFGLVASYAVPMLVSKGGGEVSVMFIYMTIINIGVIFLAFRKGWYVMNITGFIVSWIIYIAWFGTAYTTDQYQTAFIFNIVFFITFYLTLIGYQSLYAHQSTETQMVFLVLNSVVFYVIGASIIYHELSPIQFLDRKFIKEIQYLTGFTLGNFVVHSLVTSILLQRKAHPNFLNFTYILAVVCLTISIPIYFEGKVIPALWAVEVALLIGITRTLKLEVSDVLGMILIGFITLNIPVSFQNETEWITLIWLVEMLILFGLARGLKSYHFELFSRVLLGLTLLSLAYMWSANYLIRDAKDYFTPIANPYFFTSVGVVAGVFVLMFLHQKFPVSFVPSNTKLDTADPVKLNVVLSFVSIALVYGLFACEIAHAHLFAYYSDLNPNMLLLLQVWLLIYSAGYIAGLSGLGWSIFRSEYFYGFVTVVNVALMVVFVIAGLADVHQLLNFYLVKLSPELYKNIRFLVYLGVLLSTVGTWVLWQKMKFTTVQNIKAYSVACNIFILILLSFELMNWFVLNYAGDMQAIESARNSAFKLGFTLLWGLYSLGLIGFGIWKKRKFLRMTGFAIFGITLCKIFFKDISYASTLNVIFALIGVGVLMMITAFLYQKYKEVILAEDE